MIEGPYKVEGTFPLYFGWEYGFLLKPLQSVSQTYHILIYKTQEDNKLGLILQGFDLLS
jgi:hypothetical protein